MTDEYQIKGIDTLVLEFANDNKAIENEKEKQQHNLYVMAYFQMYFRKHEFTPIQLYRIYEHYKTK